MKLTQRIAESQEAAEQQQRKAAPGQRQRERAERKRQRQLEAAQRAEALRARVLDDADRALAGVLRVPSDRPGRVAMAQDLRTTSGGRTRTHDQIAALMGVSAPTVTMWLNFPTREAIRAYEEDRDRRRAEGQVRRTRPPKPSKPLPEVDAPVPDWIRAMRRAYNLSQRALADVIHVDRSTVQRWEAGEDRPSAENAAALHRYFAR
jgi:DNA-binding transcriptional regulator YiaG